MKTLLLSSPPFSTSLAVTGVSFFFSFFGKSRHRETIRDRPINDDPIPFESLFSLIGDPVFLIEISPEDVPGRIVEANEAASEVYGYTLSEFRTLTLSDLLKPDKNFLRLLKERFPIFLQTGRFRGESVHIAKSGREFPIEFSARLVVKDGLKFNLTLIRDISEQNRLEEEKAKEKEWYETLFSLIDEPAILFELDPGRAPDRVVEVNSAATRIYGYSRDVFLTLSSGDLVSPNADPRLLSGANSTLREHGFCHFDSIHRNRARADLFIETSARLFEKDGKRYALHLNRDITARKRSEETERALAQTERKVLAGENVRPVIDAFCRELGRIFPSMDLGLYKKNPNGKAELLAGGYSYRLKTLSLDNSPEGYGAVAMSIKTEKTQIFDILDPAYPEELRSMVREMGIRYTWSIPLFLKKEVHGALAFVTAEEFPPVFEDILWLEGLSGRIALLYVLGREQREIRLGYDALQGFYFYYPCPPEEITRLISAQNAKIRRSNSGDATNENDPFGDEKIDGKRAGARPSKSGRQRKTFAEGELQ